MPDKIVPINRGETRVRYTDPENDGVYAEVVSNSVGVFDVTDPAYGAVGDGVTDDQPAIQAAIDAAGAAGGGTVYLGPGTYLLSSLEIAATAHLWNPYSNVTMLGEGAILKATDAYAILYQGKQTSFASATTYAVTSAVARGANTITTATAAHAGNFAAGDYIFIRTGQCVDSLVGQPDAEINRVVSAVAGTGVITLAWPTSKRYAQEYFITGTTGKTSTNVTANPSIYAVANITSLIVTDQVYRGLRFEQTTSGDVGYGMIGGRVLRCLIERCYSSSKTGFQSVGQHRFYTVRDCHLHQPGAVGTYTYTLTADSGCTDTTWAFNQITGAHVSQMHVHEGAAKVKIIGNTVSFPESVTSGENAVSIRARGYDILIADNIFDCATPSVVYVDDSITGGGTISDNHFLGASGFGTFVTSSGWYITGNRYPNGAEPYALGTTGIDNELRVMSAWVDSSHQTVTLGYLPGNAVVIRVTTQVTTTFNSNGTDNISVGFDTDGLSGAGLGANVDVSTTGIKAHTLGGYAGFTATLETLVKAYYTNGGSEPNQGKALVTVEYAIVAQWP